MPTTALSAWILLGLSIRPEAVEMWVPQICSTNLRAQSLHSERPLLL